jgi:hypothetical protein
MPRLDNVSFGVPQLANRIKKKKKWNKYTTGKKEDLKLLAFTETKYLQKYSIRSKYSHKYNVRKLIFNIRGIKSYNLKI